MQIDNTYLNFKILYHDYEDISIIYFILTFLQKNS